MAAIDFPASPTVGQQFTPASGVTYQWNGTVWFPVATFPTASNVQSAALGANIVCGTAMTASVNTGSIGASGQVWELIGRIAFCDVGGGGGGYWSHQIWNGAATVDAITSYLNGSTAFNSSVAMLAQVTLSGPTTFSLRSQGPSSFSNILADGTRIIAKRLA